jgi:hypothetical protein
MSFGVAVRNAVAIGLGGIVTLFSGTRDASALVQNLLLEDGGNLLYEDGGLILLE